MSFYAVLSKNSHRAFKTDDAIFQVVGLWTTDEGESLFSRPMPADEATEFNLLNGLQRDHKMITLDDLSELNFLNRSLYKNENREHHFVIMNVYLPTKQATEHIRDDLELDFLIEFSCDEFKQLIMKEYFWDKIEDSLWFSGNYRKESKIPAFQMNIHNMCFLGTICDYSDKMSFEFEF